MSTKAPRPQMIEASEFFLALIRALFLKGINSFNPRSNRSGRNSFHLSMHQAFVWFVEYYKGRDDVLIGFRFYPHWLYGTSPIVESEITFLLSLSLAHTRSPGDGTVYLDMSIDSTEQRLFESSIPRELMEELAERFVREYDLPRQERTWPEGYETPGQS